MPLFEYRCRACSHLEEVLQKHGEGPPAACPHCNKKGTLEKALSLPSFQLKGGGWYKDLYASAKPDSSTSESGSDGSSSKGESTSKAAAKEATKSAPKDAPKSATKKEAKSKKASSSSSGSSGSSGGGSSAKSLST